MKTLATILVIFVLSCRVSLAQNVLISYGIPAPKSNDLNEVLDYVSQMKALERSLVSGSLKNTLAFSKEFTLIDSVFKKFSERFNASIPKNFFTQEGGYKLVSGEMGEQQKNPRIQWDYAAIEKPDSVILYAQLIVHFERYKKNETPRIRGIELQTEDVITVLTDEQIIQLFEKAKSVRVEFVPPPIPDIKD